jgi:hypothetical protein
VEWIGVRGILRHPSASASHGHHPAPPLKRAGHAFVTVLKQKRKAAWACVVAGSARAFGSPPGPFYERHGFSTGASASDVASKPAPMIDHWLYAMTPRHSSRTISLTVTGT